MSYLGKIAKYAPAALSGASKIVSLLFGGDLIYDKNSSVDDKITFDTRWTPIYVMEGQGSIPALKTTLRIMGAVPLPQGKTFNWDRGSGDFLDYGIIDAQCDCAGSPANDRMPSSIVAVLVIKKYKQAINFNGTGDDSPSFDTLPLNTNAADLQNLPFANASVWSDPDEIVDAKRVRLNGYDSHCTFAGGFTGSEFPGEKLAGLQKGDMLLLAYRGTNANNLVSQAPNWEPSDDTLAFGSISGSVSVVYSNTSATAEQSM